MFYSRGKNKIQNPYTFRDMYKDYIEGLVDGENSPLWVEYNVYVKICSDYYKAIMELILEDGIEYKMPHFLGRIRVAKNKIKLNKTLPVDWQTTYSSNSKVVHLNEHTDGYRYFFYWQRSSIKNRFFYRLVFTRWNKRRLAKLIKEEGKDYFEI